MMLINSGYVVRLRPWGRSAHVSVDCWQFDLLTLYIHWVVLLYKMHFIEIQSLIANSLHLSKQDLRKPELKVAESTYERYRRDNRRVMSNRWDFSERWVGVWWIVKRRLKFTPPSRVPFDWFLLKDLHAQPPGIYTYSTLSKQRDASAFSFHATKSLSLSMLRMNFDHCSTSSFPNIKSVDVLDLLYLWTQKIIKGKACKYSTSCRVDFCNNNR